MNISIPKEFRELAEKVVSKYECSIYSLGFYKEKKQNILRLTIDGANTSLDICSKISRDLSKWLDSHEDDLKVKSYEFEVSSPGPDKKIETEEEFKKNINKIVNFETKTKASDGRKKYRGKIMSVENGIIHIYVDEESAEFDLEVSDIKKARREYEF